MTFSGLIGWLPAAAIDAAFLLALAAVIAREIMTGRNWRNLKVVVIVSILAAGNIAFHLEAFARGSAEYAGRLAIGTLVLLLALVGGRIVPSFTHNWLARQAQEVAGAVRPLRQDRDRGKRRRAGGLDRAADGARDRGRARSRGRAAGVRLARWAGYRSAGEPLVAILHVGYASFRSAFCCRRRRRSISFPPPPASMPGRRARSVR